MSLIQHTKFTEIDDKTNGIITEFVDIKKDMSQWLPALTENGKNENKDNAIDLKQTKYYVEMLLINLSSLAQGDNNGGPSSDQLQTSRTAIMNLEDRYLNEKNPMLQAFSYFWINTGISRTIAKIALAFAIIVDLLNLIIGIFIQWIEKEDKQTVDSAQPQERVQDESTSGDLAQ